MEIDRPSAADYASSAAYGAQRSSENAWEEIGRLNERLAIAEKKIEGLFLVLNYVIDGDQLNNFVVNDETGELKYNPDSICNPKETGCGGVCSGCE